MAQTHGGPRGMQGARPTSALHEVAVNLADEDVMGGMIRDLLKLPELGASTSRGTRVALDRAAGQAKLDDLLGDRCQDEAFPVAFKALARGLSIRQTAARAHLSRNVCHQLMLGKVAPTMAEMESVARAFQRRPIWFREYRTALICSIVAQHLDAHPERSATIVHQLLR